MSEPIKKPNQTPESYSPTAPEIISMANIPDDNKVNGAEVPFLFKKQIIHLPKSLLVGKKVTYPKAKQGVPEEEGGNPPLNLVWQEYKKDGTRDWLIQQKDSAVIEAFLGLYCDLHNNDGMFSYIVGALMKADTVIPEKFAYHEIPESDVAVCWYKYRDEDDIWSVAHGTISEYLKEQGYEGIPDVGWCSELYPFGDNEYKEETGYNLLGYLIACRKKEEA